ncbi:MAG: YgiQ family radical SAM protein, partial [Synergistaceae bacterium]|nr:YgiQ family radical SAM protein [Synergistaceae bacterium]
MTRSEFLPVTRDEMERLGWRELDFLCIVGDAYVDHPTFGHAVVSRFLGSLGYRVGIIAQPDWRSAENFGRLGRPRLAVLVAAGNLDSMLSNYSSPGKRRGRDAYSPGGRPGLRPDRATIVYCNRVRELWKDVPLVIGGIEASLRRFAHYDFWSDDVRRSILVDSRADLLIYGMAESALEAVSARLASGVDIRSVRDIPGTCWKTHERDAAGAALELPSFETVRGDKKAFAEAFRIFYMEQNFADGRAMIQDNGPWMVVHNQPPPPMSKEALDRIYELPYARRPHPSYEEEIPALSEVLFSITSHRGCFGECAFCAITSHQGRVIQPRGKESMLREARTLAAMPEFKGYINDVGGPTANFMSPPCKKSALYGPCRGKSCLFPGPCESLSISHREFIELLRAVRALPGVKKVFVRSGLRYDYILADPEGGAFLEELCSHHVSGQLKIAPEHCSSGVLERMKKPLKKTTEKFIAAFREANKRLGKKQFLTPYFMSGHPGCGLEESLELALFLKAAGFRPEQVQEFAPTPGTPAACMYHTEIDPFTGERVYVAKTDEEKKMQRALLQYWMPRNRALVAKAL